MRLRTASIAFLLGTLGTGVAWLTVQPALIALLDALRKVAAPDTPALQLVTRVRTLLPWYLALDLLVLSVLAYVILHITVGRPLRKAEETIEQISRMEWEFPLRPSGGPLLSRLQSALLRLSEALRTEQALTRKQLAELTETNARLARVQTELVVAERLATVGKLAAGVAHEVGNPLGGILGYLSLIRARTAGSPESRDLVDRIEQEVQRIDQIVRGLLDLGRPTGGKPEPVDVETIVCSCVKLVSAGPDFTQVKVHVSIEPGTVARAEAGPLSQVVLNLLLNAAQAMEGQGQIWVRGCRVEGMVELSVLDSGPGLAAEVLPRLFEPFFTTRFAGKGTGLGLAVSQHLVATMGGSLQATNAPQGGALFSVRLPAS